MAKCDPIHFSGVSAEVFNRISSELASKGFSLSGPSGVVNGPYGIVIQYEWNEQNETISLQVVDKSFFVSCNQIKQQLSEAFTKYA